MTTATSLWTIITESLPSPKLIKLKEDEKYICGQKKVDFVETEFKMIKKLQTNPKK